MPEIRPKRILHVVGGMVRAGVETWLMQALRLLDPRRVQIDFLVHTNQPCAYDREIESRGSHLLRCTESRLSPAYGCHVSSLIHAFGPYNAVHSHVHHFSGYLLWLARLSGIPNRIAHSHSDTLRLDRRAGWLRSGYLRWAKERIRRNATRMVAASHRAGVALYGDRWESDHRSHLLHCGIDLAPFRAAPERSEIRAALGIREDDFVIGHTGRFAAPKNHPFLLEIVAECKRVRPETRLLLVGDGPARHEIESRVRQLGIDKWTFFTGVREDVPALLKAMDVFVFPSLWEGLGLALVEAQAAGLPCLIADNIPEEADVVPGQIKRLPLAAGVTAWVRELLRAPAPLPGDGPLRAVEQSTFNIERSLENLYALYDA